MPTVNQLVKKGRIIKKGKGKSPALQFVSNTLKRKKTDPLKKEAHISVVFVLRLQQLLQKNQTQHFVRLQECVFQMDKKLQHIFQE